jgi:hypothetical protein
VALNTFDDKGAPAASDQFQYFHTEKVSYQMNQANKFIGFLQYNYQGGMSPGNQFTTWDARLYSPTHATISKVEWQTIIGGNKFVSLQVGAWIWNISRQCYSNDVAKIDQLNSAVSGCNVNYGIESFEGRNHSKGTMSAQAERFFGNHDMKVGFDTRGPRGSKISPRRHKNPVFHLTGNPGNYQLIYRNGVPLEMAARNNSYWTPWTAC